MARIKVLTIFRKVYLAILKALEVVRTDKSNESDARYKQVVFFYDFIFY